MVFRKTIVILLALLLAAMAMVPLVSADEKNLNYGKADLVDKASLERMTPSLILNLKNEGLTEDKIAEYLLKLPTPRQVGWTDADNELAIENLKKYRFSSSDRSEVRYMDVQRDGRMAIDEANYNGINGYMRPGNLEVSASGTEAHYFTSHIGYAGRWIEVGVARFNSNPSQYIVYTYDSGRPSGQEWKTWGTTNPNTLHHFLIYVYDTDDGSGKPYTIWWDDTMIDSGHTPYYWNNPDENHEFFAASASNFESCSQGYYTNSFLYRKEGSNYNAYWWNANLPEVTHAYGMSPVLYSKTPSSGSTPFTMTTWI